MEKKILPISRQSFRKLREDNCIYVDKTQHIYNLALHGGMYFLSRPRRFGKSLFLSTLKELFLGSKALFEGTWIENKWDWTQKSPVIYISFLTVSYEKQGLEAGLIAYLLGIYEENKIEPTKEENIKALFFDLIKKLHDKHGKVVILIDEYDKAILDYMEFSKMPEAKANQEILAVFYGALKEADIYIRLLFITGISKFTRVSLFSKLNSLSDLTINPKYSTMLGYTQEELEGNFSDYIDESLVVFPHYTRQELLAKIKLWYNGYSWDGKTRLYNPFGILLFFANQDFQSYWFQSGTPTFVAKILEQKPLKLYNLEEEIETSINFLNKSNIENIDCIHLLFETGYLTIKEKSEDGDLVLHIPNKDARHATLALQQIKTKKYAVSYAADSRIKVGIGVNFQSSNKEMAPWETEIL